MEPLNVACCIIFNEKNEVLLQKKDLSYPWLPGKWCFFGGKIEEGENPLQTLKRELKEELNYSPDNFKFFMKHSFKNECYLGIRKGIQNVYLSEFKGSLSELSIREGGGFAFFDESELESIPISHYDLKALKKYFSQD